MKFTTRLGIAALSTLVAVAAWAADVRTEAQSRAAAAVAHLSKVGAEQGAKDLSTAADWKVKGININFVDMKGVVLASSLNERLIGKNTYESKDPTGKEFVKEFIATAKKGEGWVDYQFVNPETKKLEDRSMFVRKVPNFDGFVAVAITR